MGNEKPPAGDLLQAVETSADRSARVTARATVWMVILNLPLAVAAVLGLWFSHETLVEQRASAKSTEQTFRADERAWVMLPPLMPIETKKNEKGETVGFSFELSLKNTGKTAAHGVVAQLLSFQNSPDFEKEVDDITAIQDKARFGVALKSPDAEAYRPPLSAPDTLAPGEVISVTRLLSARVPDFSKHPTGWFSYFIGRVDYLDAFGAPHWLTFCQFAIGGGGLRYCTSGNNRDADSATPASDSK